MNRENNKGAPPSPVSTIEMIGNFYPRPMIPIPEPSPVVIIFCADQGVSAEEHGQRVQSKLTELTAEVEAAAAHLDSAISELSEDGLREVECWLGNNRLITPAKVARKPLELQSCAPLYNRFFDAKNRIENIRRDVFYEIYFEKRDAYWKRQQEEYNAMHSPHADSLFLLMANLQKLQVAMERLEREGEGRPTRNSLPL